MKKALKYCERIAVLLSIAMILSLMPVLGTETRAAGTSTRKTVPATSEKESVDNIEFDGKGNLNGVMPSMVTPSDGADAVLQHFPSLIIDGDQYQCDSTVKYFTYLTNSEITVDQLNPDDQVGFKKDHADRIYELWILPPAPTKSITNVTKKTSTQPNPKGSPTALKKEDGVWKN